MATAFAVALTLLMASSARAERVLNPADATVFVRVTVSLRASVQSMGGIPQPVETELRHVSGSGFVFSPLGYVLTNHHVVSPVVEQLVTPQPGVEVSGVVTVAGIAVCLPREAPAWADLVAEPGPDESKCLDASVLADDETLDLAVLSVTGPALPYLALGDSDAVNQGEPQRALGFPLGSRLEIGNDSVSAGVDIVPALTEMPGSVTAFRMGCGTSVRRGPCVTAADRNRERRYLQLSNTLHPGNSGGPVVDADGFVIGIVESRPLDADGRPVEGIAFAVPTNVVKDFLDARGLDSSVSTRRLWSGQVHNLDAKRLRVQLPEGMNDIGGTVTRVEVDAQQAGLTFRIDRVLSPWNSQRIEDALLDTAIFERGSWPTRQSRVITGGGRAVRVGRAVGTITGGSSDAWLMYGILDLGTEKVIARYMGPAESLAFNEKVLTDSLTSLDGQRFPVPDASFVERLDWLVGTDAQGRPAVPIPAGWAVTGEGPSPCVGLPSPDGAAGASAGDDYALRLRTAVWSEGRFEPGRAAAICSPARGSQPGASYSSQFEFLGVPYVVDGLFVRPNAGQLVRLEVLAPLSRAATAQALLSAWVRRAVR